METADVGPLLTSSSGTMLLNHPRDPSTRLTRKTTTQIGCGQVLRGESRTMTISE